MSIIAPNLYFPSPNYITTKIPNISALNSTCLLFTSPQFHNYTLKIQSSFKMAQNPAVVQQKIYIPNKNNNKLVGVLHDTRSKGIVVICHGYRCTKEFFTLVNLAVALESEGISVFRFDFSGNGESEGSFQFGNYQEEVEDLRSVVEHFTHSGRAVTAVLGHSKGGNNVLLYASKYHDILAVVNVSGRYQMDRGIKERLGEDFLERLKKDGFIDMKNEAGEVEYRVTEESMMERLNTNMHEACLLISDKCRVLTVHGSADEVIPVEDAIEISKLIRNHKLHIVEGANHSYTSHQSELAAVVVPFIKENFQ
ncbi:hypothetical protein Leryth_002327 [Lithospermum erythrorhizon]|nr:hypothetical protein Leryth_002327 [Lithospermum erythrorhizon]